MTNRSRISSSAAVIVGIIVLSMGSMTVQAFYMPGVKPVAFRTGAEVPVKVNALTSIHTQIPKDYYRLAFCYPEGGPKMASENLGEFLTGNKIQSSPYTLNMGRDKHCQILCQRELNKYDAKMMTLHIRLGYHHNWIIDNLPSASLGLDETGEKQKHYAGGFPIGFVDSASGDDRDAYVYNHVNIHVDYHEPEGSNEEGYRVVGFAVEPLSVSHKFLDGYEWDGLSQEGFSKNLESCASGVHMDRADIKANQIVKEGEKILYTYDVIWMERRDVAWSSRWDVYLTEDHLVPAQVHWYSITNSILVVLFLSLLVVSILVRNLRRDIAGYNAVDDEEGGDKIDETGWKLVHGDVFRPPSNFPMTFCALIGSGLQITVAGFFAIVFSAAGFLNPARRGSLMIGLLVLYMIFGILAGYASSRLYKSFRGRAWQLCTLLTATLFPGTAFTIFLFFNIVLFFFHSSGSVPFVDVLIVAAMWCCVSIPLVFLGAYVGYSQPALDHPTKTSTIPRAVPAPASPLLHPYVGMILAGVVPFAAAYVELFFIMTSLWMDQFYYVFGFTLIVYIILLVTCAEVTVLLVYYQLCGENHRWWWYSFITSGSTAGWMFIYSFFWFGSLEASKMMITYMLYFGYMFLICGAIFIASGTVGALTCYWFTRLMFSSIKVD